MPERVVITRSRRTQAPVSREFAFTRGMVPGIETHDGLPTALKNYRLAAWEQYETLPMPTTKDEPWRRTDLHGMPAGAFHLPGDQAAGLESPPAELLKPLVGDEHGGQLVLTPAGSRLSLDPALAGRGVIFTDYMTAERRHADLLSRFVGQIVRPDEGKFAAMAAALARTGAFVYIPRGVVVEQPLHSILWGPGANLAYFSHIVVWVDDGAALTFVHENASRSQGDEQSLHCGIVEVHVGEGANLRFVELQSWGNQVWNFSHERARVMRDGNLDWIFGAIGSHLTKNFSDLDLVGQGSTGRMSGFYFTNGVQHLDHDTQQNHLAPNTTSDLLFKGALKEKSRSVWQGMIYVAPGAQKTDGYQANRNLVLSEKARADSIPGLEILADDVRCTHGATVGKIDADQVFYLRSRGIPYDEAERLIVEGFFDPIMQRIPFEGVRSRFQDAIEDKMRG
jgi:Fe-S cluster assembly protein SufD